MLTKKNEVFKQYIANGKSQTSYEWLQFISNSLTETIRSSKENFYYNLSTKLVNSSASSKAFSLILKIFVNDLLMKSLPPTFYKKLTYSTNFSANNV